MTDVSDVFAAYGRAAYYSQLLEYDLISIWMLDSITQGVSVTRGDLVKFQGDWSQKTLGKLLHPLKQSPLLPADLKQFLEIVRKTRNTLAHDFFLTVGTDLQTPNGRETAIAELHQMTNVLMNAQTLFRNVLAEYGRDFGVDYDEIIRQLLKENAEQGC